MVETWCEPEPGGPCRLCTLSVKPGEHFYRALTGAVVHEECLWLEHDLYGAPSYLSPGSRSGRGASN